MIHFGPAGWHYRDWQGVVYPPKGTRGFDPLRYLAQMFSCVEINSTYYAPASSVTADKWIDRVRDFPDFRFTGKLWKRFTHDRGSAWTQSEVATARAAFDRLQGAGRLGALVLQFPWSFKRTPENREWLDDLTREFRDFPLVIEVRHETWNTPSFYGALVERGIGFVNIDQPIFRQSIKPSSSVTSPVGYIRVHGRNYADWFRRDATVEARYDYLYSREELEPWSQRAAEVAKSATETFVVTNNHYRGKAVANALMLQALFTGVESPSPLSLYNEYREALAPFAIPVRLI